jgi:hypothetical protein
LRRNDDIKRYPECRRYPCITRIPLLGRGKRINRPSDGCRSINKSYKCHDYQAREVRERIIPNANNYRGCNIIYCIDGRGQHGRYP